MKPKHFLFALILGTVLFSACKKTDTNTNTEEIETSFALTADAAMADNLVEDASDVKDEAFLERGLLENLGPVGDRNLTGCAIITATPQNGFPKTIIIDFGTGCVGPNGITRKGKIQIIISDSLRVPGSTAIMTFDNYFVNQFKIEGQVTWTNTSSGNTRSWSRVVQNGKIIAPDGRFWLHNSTKNVVQTAGASTPRFLRDDIYSITGNGTVSNSAGRSRTSTIINALQKKVACENIDQGTIRFESANHYAILDFGNGICDRFATISINGRPPRTIVLR